VKKTSLHKLIFKVERCPEPTNIKSMRRTEIQLNKANSSSFEKTFERLKNLPAGEESEMDIVRIRFCSTNKNNFGIVSIFFFFLPVNFMHPSPFHVYMYVLYFVKQKKLMVKCDSTALLQTTDMKLFYWKNRDFFL
jgi:hypothetical protein